MTDRALKVELFDQFARVAQAAASGRRVEIVDVLANGERSVEELSRQVAMSVANTSRHLQVLKEAGLVAATREGARVRYRLASPAVYRFWVALRSLAAERLPGVRGLVEAYLGSREGLEAISGDELLARLRSGEPLVVVDVRPTEEYQAAHVAGAVSIPLAELEQRLRELPREREIVAYCRGPYCAFAPEAVRTIRGTINRRRRWPRYSIWSTSKRCARKCARSIAKSPRTPQLTITSTPGAPMRFDLAIRRSRSTSFPITPAKLLPAWAILSFGAGRSLVRGLSISALEPVWTPSWRPSGWAAKER